MFALRHGGAFSFFLRDILKFGFVLLHHYLFTQVCKWRCLLLLLLLFCFVLFVCFFIFYYNFYSDREICCTRRTVGLTITVCKPISQFFFKDSKINTLFTSQDQPLRETPLGGYKDGEWHIIAELQRTKRASGAPWVIKSSNLCMREIWAVTSVSASVRTYSGGGGVRSKDNPTQGGECHLFLTGK